MSQRQERVSQRIKEEVSTIIHDQIKDPRIGFFTITRVKLAPDLRFARIFYSIMGTDEQKKEAQEGLDSALKYIRRLVGERMELRYTPDLCFQLDESGEYSMRINEIFEKLEEEKKNKDTEGKDLEND
ncbi:MAG: 30S ribosome-binding factor RbfA [PVC group bacterium]|nr:30S ribosome-binding factor RbfA [PVC group bacterium]